MKFLRSTQTTSALSALIAAMAFGRCRQRRRCGFGESPLQRAGAADPGDLLLLASEWMNR
jgi:hypothetical protein